MFFTSNELKSTFVCDLGDCSSSRPCMGAREMFCFQCSVKRYHTFFVSDSFLPDTVSEKEKEREDMKKRNRRLLAVLCAVVTAAAGFRLAAKDGSGYFDCSDDEILQMLMPYFRNLDF